LHDTLAQGLTGLHLQLEAIRTGLGLQRYGQVQEMVEQSLSGTRSALTEARRAIDDLRAGTVSPENLSVEVQQVIRHCIVATTITCTTDLAALVFVPVALCEQVLRAIKEGLTNVIRHARAHHVWVEVSRRECMLVIEIRDDGIGFDPAIVETSPGHYGLLGLRERTLLVGGDFSITSVPGAGTALRLHFPESREGVRNTSATGG
jgi:two-component system, NarL family, sensor histidine kinase YdfH